MQLPPQTWFLLRHFADQSIDRAKPAQEDMTPIYEGGFDFAELKKMRNDIRDFPFKYYEDLKGGPISEDEHKKRLRSLCTTLTRRYKYMLSEQKYRLGITQRIVNLYLKLLWSAGLIDPPHHCPFDGMVKRKIIRFAGDGWLEPWNEFTAMSDYEDYVSAARLAASAEGLSIAEWDIKHFH